MDAAKDFYNAAKGKKFEQFKKEYKIWDEGINYFTGKYDEFVSSNMTEKGYKNMFKAIGKYLEKTKEFEKGTTDSYSFTNTKSTNEEQPIYEQETSKGRSH